MSELTVSGDDSDGRPTIWQVLEQESRAVSEWPDYLKRAMGLREETFTLDFAFDMSTGQYTDWCRGHFALMAQDGIWGVPRSGLIFTKRGDQLVLTQRMPYTPELAEAAAEGKDVPLTPEELRAYQDADYELIREQFGAAGIEVVDSL